MRQIRQSTAGFTLIELLLAMTLFTTVMLVATVGFIGINRTYTRGMVKKQLSESIQTITEDMTRSLRAQVSNTKPEPCDGDCVPQGWSNISFSGSCYLWVKDSPSGGLYKSPGACAEDSVAKKTGLLDERFMVHDLKVTPVKDAGALGGKTLLFRISGNITTTDQTALKDDPDPNSSGYKVCKGTSENVGVATCAAESFSFVVAVRGAAS